MQNDDEKQRVTKLRDARQWQIGTANEVDWITKATTIDRTITSGIPPVYADYATVERRRAIGGVLRSAGAVESSECLVISKR